MNFNQWIAEQFPQLVGQVQLIPEVLEIIDPPKIVKNKRYKLKFSSILLIERPEVDKLLKTLMKECKKFKSFIEKNSTNVNIKDIKIKIKSS